MRNLCRTLLLVAVCVIAAFSTLAQSAEEIGQIIVKEIAQELNSPQQREVMKKVAELSDFSASAKGNILTLNITASDPLVDFSALSAKRRTEITNSFKDMLMEGLAGGEDREMIIQGFRTYKIKVQINLYDQYGNTMSKTVEF